MKVYVDKLPKSCLECFCRNGEYNYCNLIAPEHSIGYYNEEEMGYKDVPINQDFEELECPLKSLAEHDKQVIKKVIDEVYAVLERAVPYELCWSWAVIKKELDRIQGEDK